MLSNSLTPLPPLQTVALNNNENHLFGEGEIFERGLRPLSRRTPALGWVEGKLGWLDSLPKGVACEEGR